MLKQFTAVKEGETVATMKTNMGDIKIKFFKEDAPKAVEKLPHSRKERIL